MLASNKKVCILTSILALIFLLILPAASRQASDATELRKLSEEELKKVLEDHQDWLKAYSESLGSEQALNDKRRANLSFANLSGANLNGVNLIGANLSKTNLIKAHLRMAGLIGANLSQTALRGTDLSGANLGMADLSGADLSGATLRWADLHGADLTKAYLSEANLRGADLSEANLSGTNLHGANLSEAHLNGAYLYGAYLYGADLSRADLSGADLNGADLFEADLSRSSFDPKVIDYVSGLLGVRGLSDIYTENVESIVDLRKKLKEAGFKNEAKALTSALRKHQRRGSLELEHLFIGIVLGGFLTDFGANPAGALKALLALIFVFAWFYLVAVHWPGEKAGIWRLRPETRLVKEKDELEREQIKWTGFWRGPLYAIYFSVLSAFHFGWRDLNLSNWVVRIQMREYTLQAAGWVRTVSGIQSLISLYLVALFLLTYFGTPFE